MQIFQSLPTSLRAPNFNTKTCSPTISSVVKFNTPLELKQVLAHVIKTNTPLSVLPLSRVASVCALTRSFSDAQKIFMHFDGGEVYHWNRCLKDLAESDSPFDAILLFDQLRENNVCPNSFTCSFVLKACVQTRDVFRGRIIHAYVEKLGLQSNLLLQNMLVNLYASCGEINDAIHLFDKMPQRDVVTWNTMITQLVKRGNVDSAYELFLQMPERNVRSWAAMIAGFVQCGKPKEAIRLYEEMEEMGLRPNEATVVPVLAACADQGMLDLGKKIHEYSKRSVFKSNIRVCNTLIDMYIKCGCLKAACNVFNDIKERTVISWSVMIHGLALHGRAEEALKLFSEMIATGMKPNEGIFTGILHACGHMGLIDEGRRFFTSMTTDYGLVPSMQHYGCMVDLLSRGGLLEEAHKFIKDMPMKPNAVIWGALLGGCKVHKNIELAEEAITHLQKLDPLNDGYYVLLSNVYAGAKRWEDAARVRKMMKNRRVNKTHGWSSISVNGVVHEFVAGDDDHPQTEEIFKKWDELLECMKLKGYVANTSVVLLDMEESEKEIFLYRHSEKLALVFGLLNTPPGETIRIFKNLRVCEDCHAAMKLISEIVNREIVVRDRNRFHCFKDGSCSCKDYW